MTLIFLIVSGGILCLFLLALVYLYIDRKRDEEHWLDDD